MWVITHGLGNSDFNVGEYREVVYFMVDTRFKPGNNANPKGRPKGSGSRQAFFREHVESRKDNLIRKALELAENGNEAMLKFFLDKVSPARYQSDALEILGSTVRETTNNLITHVSTGDMSAEEASKVASIVQKDAEINNQTIMIEKLKGLESRIDESNKQDIVIEETNQDG